MRRRRFAQMIAVAPAAQGLAQIPMNNSYMFVGGGRGRWKVTQMSAYLGEPLKNVSRVDVMNGQVATPSATWVLRGFTSNTRYATSGELTSLRGKQQGLGRPEATCAALIPIRKTAAWWDLAQDERRAIFEETSHHTAIGMEYLPAIARRLHHSRDLGEPFDFLTWFEFAPKDKPAFDELVKRLRETREWKYVEREVDIRLERIDTA